MSWVDKTRPDRDAIESINRSLTECPHCGMRAARLRSELEDYYEKWTDYADPIHVETLRRQDYWTVCCDRRDGGCGMLAGWHPTKEEAAKAWNRRA